MYINLNLMLFTSSLVSSRGTSVSKNEKFCIENEELCIKSEEFCIKNEEICIKIDEFCSGRQRAQPHRFAFREHDK